MRIDNHGHARLYLAQLNYNRLAAYWVPFEQIHSTHSFKPGTTFDLVLDHYVFDRELRLLVMDAIERVGVSIRVERPITWHILTVRSPVIPTEAYSFWTLSEKY
jgi:abortive infection bacteriophage resistance protein